jgi:aldose 1-epimerase
VAVALALAVQMEAKTTVTKQPFGKTEDGAAVDLYTLKNEKIETTITTYGGRIVTLKVPDRSGKVADIVTGFDSLDGYLKTNPYFGAIVGRYANRIAHGKFVLDGMTYTLAKNDGDNTLHGGLRTFDKRVWDGKIQGDSLVLHYLSKDGEEGFPGNLSVTVTYTLAGNELKIDYEATTDKDTVLNLSNHSYFNLKGQGEGTILEHEVTLLADRFTPVDQTLIPTGELRPVAGTPMDFRTPLAIGARIGNTDEQLKFGRGYDHNWVLNSVGGSLSLAAKVHEPTTGRVLEVLTTQPGLQFYTGNFLDGTITGKGGKVYQQRFAFCMETQHFPDSPNHPAFPTSELKPGQKFHNTTVFRFSAQ